MIFEYEHDKRMTPLLPITHRYKNNNSFTVVVGPNGIGKSRLLAAIAGEARGGLRQLSLASFAEDVDRVIAVSTSPFDKFPLNYRTANQDSDDNRYRYIGMRSRTLGPPSSVALISAAAKGLLRNHAESRNNHRLAEAFELLGFSPALEFVFKIHGTIDRSTLVIKTPYPSYGGEKRVEPKNQLDHINLIKAYDLLKRSADNNANMPLGFSLHSNTFYVKDTNFSDNGIISGLLLLLEHQVVRLMDLKLHKNNFGEMSLRRASSGEQCIVVSMLGIAGNIIDNSLVLIDEPEISLHPEWQERYVQLLTTVFSEYERCQFIIATHSPQIVANLPPEDCYVLALQENILHPSADFRARSSDYQLAKLFLAPGIRNEYLGRIAMNLFAKISKNKLFHQNDAIALDELKFLQQYLSKSDPVYELIDSLTSMRMHYGND